MKTILMVYLVIYGDSYNSKVVMPQPYTWETCQKAGAMVIEQSSRLRFICVPTSYSLGE